MSKEMPTCKFPSVIIATSQWYNWKCETLCNMVLQVNVLSVTVKIRPVLFPHVPCKGVGFLKHSVTSINTKRSFWSLCLVFIWVNKRWGKTVEKTQKAHFQDTIFSVYFSVHFRFLWLAQWRSNKFDVYYNHSYWVTTKREKTLSFIGWKSRVPGSCDSGVHAASA